MFDAGRYARLWERVSVSPVAAYRRTVRASLARVWENVLDWEHLPWLHRDTFAHVRLLERRPDGFRVETAMRADPATCLHIDVAIDRAAREYHSRTVLGPGTGTDIVTRLVPSADHATDVDVTFLVPDVPADRRERVGRRFTALYTRLWDEDEAMMIRRQAALDGDVAAPFRLVHVDGRPLWHATVCPHLGGPLDAGSVVDGIVTCPWHGYRFDVRTGCSADGRRLRLATPPA